MTERQFYHFSNLCHLFSAATNVIVADFGKVCLLIFPLDGITFGVDDSILSDNTVFRWIRLEDFEFDCSASTTGNECIAFSDWAVSCVQSERSELSWIILVRRSPSEKYGLMNTSKMFPVRPASKWNVSLTQD